MLKPLMEADEIAVLTTAAMLVPTDGVIVEWGQGGSTSLFASVLTNHQHLYSIEHDAAWHKKVSLALQELPEDKQQCISLFQIQSHTQDPNLWLGNGPFAPRGQLGEEIGFGLKHYINAVVNDQCVIPWPRVNMVLVDGLARAAVLATIRPKLRVGTRVFLHDYVGREDWYDWAVHNYERIATYSTLLELRVPEN